MLYVNKHLLSKKLLSLDKPNLYDFFCCLLNWRGVPVYWYNWQTILLPRDLGQVSCILEMTQKHIPRKLGNQVGASCVSLQFIFVNAMSISLNSYILALKTSGQYRYYYPGQKIETATQAKHRRVHAREITLLRHVHAVFSIFLARAVVNITPKFLTCIFDVWIRFIDQIAIR